MSLIKKKEQPPGLEDTFTLTVYLEDQKRMILRKRLEATYLSMDDAVRSALSFDKKLPYLKMVITDNNSIARFTLWADGKEAKE